MTDPDLRRRNRRTVLFILPILFAMIGLTAAAVPLYDWFCRVTGYGGTTRVAEAAPGATGERTIRVTFNADTNRNLPWRFAPAQREVTARLGEEMLVFYRAENTSDEPVVGTATFNVTPMKAGIYFNKIECFCFVEQRLEPGQAIDMPVQFFIDPALAQDRETDDVRVITLSYTFFRARGDDVAARGQQAATDRRAPARD